MGRADSKFKIGTALRSLLLSDETVSALVGSNIFPCIAPADTDTDYIVYYRDMYGIEKTKQGICQQSTTVMVVIMSDDYERSQDIAEAVFEALQGKRNGVEYSLKDSTEDYIDKKYTQILQFNIT